MRVLVTGATGLLGRGVAEILVARGTDVVAVVRPGSTAPAGTEPLVHDLFEPFPPSALPRVDCIVHLASHPHVTTPEHATALHRLNTSSTQELLEAARLNGVSRFVYASSGTVYDFADHVLDEDAPLRATHFYGLTKMHAEAFVRIYAEYFDTIILRPFFPYGLGQQYRLVPLLADRIRRGEPIMLHQNAAPRINPLFVDDAVEGIVAAADGRAPALLNLAGPDIVSIRELAEAIAAVLGRTPSFDDAGDSAGGDMIGGIARFEAVLGRPLISLTEGLRRVVTPAP